jgi:phosphoribosylanthranilate isomerase
MTTASIIKICGLSTAPTLRAALDAGTDMVGFVFFDKSPRHVTLDEARALAALARGRARIAALTVDASDDALDAIIAAAAPDFLQLHGRETPERAAAVARRFGRRVIKAIGVSGAEDLARARAYANVVDHLLFDAKPPRDARLPGGNGVAFDWRLIAGFDARKPFLLSGGLDAANVGEAIAIAGARGVDVSSGVESAPGIKDIARIEAFIAAARGAFARADAAARLSAHDHEAQPGRVA